MARKVTPVASCHVYHETQASQRPVSLKTLVTYHNTLGHETILLKFSQLKFSFHKILPDSLGLKLGKEVIEVLLSQDPSR